MNQVLKPSLSLQASLFWDLCGGIFSRSAHRLLLCPSVSCAQQSTSQLNGDDRWSGPHAMEEGSEYGLPSVQPAHCWILAAVVGAG